MQANEELIIDIAQKANIMIRKDEGTNDTKVTVGLKEIHTITGLS